MSLSSSNDALTRRGMPSSDAIRTLLTDVLQMPDQIRQANEQLSSLKKDQNHNREVLDRLTQKVDAGAQQDRTFARQLDTLGTDTGRTARALEALCQRQDVLEAASQQQRILTEQFFEQRVIEPLTRMCVPIIDLIDDVQRSGDGVDDAEATAQAVRTQLLELLAIYGVEPCTSSEGCAFDPKVMQPMGSRPTEQPELEKTIARSLRVGWRRGDRMLRPECVIVNRHQPRTQNQLQQGG